MSDAATQTDVADMSQSEMVDQLAAMFDVKESLPNEQQSDQAAEEVEATAVEGDEATLEEDDADQGQEAQATEELEADTADDSVDDKWMPQSIEELAEALEVEPDKVLETLKIRGKADGQEYETTLKDVVANNQIRKTLDQRLEQHAHAVKNFEAQATERIQRLDKQLKDADLTMSALEQMLFQDYQAVNWSELKDDDPTDYMLKQQEMRDRYASIQEVKAKLEADRKEDQQKQAEQWKASMQQYVQEQMAAAQGKIPEWKDQQQMATDLAGIQKYLVTNLGATEQELSQLVDHRMYVLALKAMKYDEMQTTANPKKKQMKSKPKFAKPGARKDPGVSKRKRKSDAFSRAKKLQTNDAWADALLEHLSE